MPPERFDTPGQERSVSRAAPDFRRAQRHSARVRWIKRLLPASILVAVVVLAVGPLIARFQIKVDLPFDLGRLSLSGSRLTMELPKLSGFTEDNRGYSISAKTASQDLTNPDVIDLAEITARLELAEKGWATVEAQKGSFDTKRQIVELGDGVDLAMNGGYGGHLADATIDVKAGSIVTEKPVTFTYLDGRLVADRLTVTDRGAAARFEGNVQLDFRLASLSKPTEGKPTEGKPTESKPEEAKPGEAAPAPAPALPAPAAPAAGQRPAPTRPSSSQAPSSLAPASPVTLAPPMQIAPLSSAAPPPVPRPVSRP